MIAANDEEIKRLITKSGNYVVNYNKDSDETDNIKPVSNANLVAFCNQLGSILKAGLPLTNALEMLYERTQDVKFKKVLGGIYESVQKGNPFSQSLASQGRAFPAIMINMVKSGELSGSLDSAMVKMADHFEKDMKMHNLVKSAMRYPIMLGAISVIVVVILVVFVLPNMVASLASDDVPLPTKLVMGLSSFIINYWYFVLGIVFFLYIAVPIIKKIPEVRYKLDKMKLTLPKFGPLTKMIYTGRFARSLATLYDCGIDLIDAMTMCSAIVGNVYVAEQIDRAVMKIKKGESISAAMAKVDSFDTLLTNMIFVGEESGVLGEILGRTADYFDEESAAATKGMTALIEPIMLIVMACVIGFIIIAMLMPMFATYNAIGGE
jgi:type IV pilus assembly protein PilC